MTSASTDASAFARRTFDLVVAWSALVVMGPLMILIAGAVWLETGGPVLFRQTRIGRFGRPFRMYKFRKFRCDAGAGSLTLAADPRLTVVGRVIMATKFDELPQLWNVVRGEMSIVGPRPESLAFADCFANGWDALLAYKPGLLGPCQILFRNEASAFPKAADVDEFYRTVLFPMKARIDLMYFRERTLASDIFILLKGVLAVCGLRPASAAGALAEARLWAARPRKAGASSTAA